ncbi:general stress protein [Bradyrhizobium sp. 27S5]|uniref:general stress protein n=1 Tax=Bradyrhizobium sp. 27S5 TaxID=3139728 RepID=UPI0030D4779D
MTITISRLYDKYNDAQQAVRRLEAAGVPHSDISIIANNSDSWFSTDKKVDRDRDGVDDRAEGAGKGAGIGAGLGGAAGLLAGLGLLAIPGLGPVVAAGWLAATAVGAAAGAATGGIVGALTEAGVSREDAGTYAEGVRRGGTLVSARVADAERSRLETILDESSVNLRDRSAAWQKAGWKSFDPTSQPYGAKEIREERQRYGGSLR